MNPIDTQIKEYYQKQTLPEERLAALRPPEDSPAPSRLLWLLPFAATATAAAVVLAVFLWQPTGQMHTLYITKLTDELRALPETTRTIDGVQVRLWTDGKCLFGLASL